MIAWRGLAESVAKYLEKGSKAGVSGSLQTRTYDANDGSKRYATEIVADEVEFLSQRKTENARPSVDELPPIDDPDLPF